MNTTTHVDRKVRQGLEVIRGDPNRAGECTARWRTKPPNTRVNTAPRTSSGQLTVYHSTRSTGSR
jgi:hypothetical protein